jgi:hypothetical protein
VAARAASARVSDGETTAPPVAGHTSAETATGYEDALVLAEGWRAELTSRDMIELGGMPPIDA